MKGRKIALFALLWMFAVPQHGIGQASLVIGNVAATPGRTTVVITWVTDAPSDSQVEYGTTSSYGQLSALDTVLTGTHTVTLAGLSVNTTYHYRARSRDASGNEAVSGDFVFATLAGIPTALGWFEVPNTKLVTVCPPDTPQYEFTFYCHGVVDAWSGAIADAARNRMIVWGGGHNDYYGNELYALNLNDLTLKRLTDPNPINSPAPYAPNCVTTLSDGKPNSRHTYNGLAYIAHADRMFSFSGSLACSSGTQLDDTWTLDLGSLQWTRMDPTAGITATSDFYYNMLAAYDPNTQKVYVHNRKGKLYSYSFETNTYTLLHDFDGQALDVNAVIDPKRKLFLFIGGGDFSAYDIQTGSTYAQQNWKSLAAGCTGLINGVVPGLAYDPVQDRIVGWAGGDMVYLLNPDTKTCTTVTYPGGPGTANGTGTYGRFRYLPAAGVLVVVNRATQNAFTLRLTAPPAGDQEPPTVAVSEPASGGILSEPTRLAATATDNTGIAGVQFRLNGVAVGSEVVLPPYEMTFDPATFANGNYLLTAVARDTSGNATTSAGVPITISNPDLTPPEITGPTATGITDSGASISWTTNEASDTQVEYGTTTAYESSSPLNSTAVTSHSVVLSGLQPSTLYYYRVKSRDAAANLATSSDFAFTTAAGPDTTFPTVTLTAPDGGATVSGTINVTANAFDNVGVAGVQFQLNGANLGAEDTTAPFQVSWNTTTASNGPSTLTVVARDAAGNTTTSSGVIVTVDNAAPVISAVSSFGIAATGATISWITNEPSDSQVEYGTTTAYGSTSSLNLALVTSHSASISGLTAGTLYHYRVRSRDAAGNLATSAEFTFTTSAAPDTTPATVSVTSPAGGATVSGTFTVTATANDNVGVAGVQFRLDGANLGAEDTSAPFQVFWNTTTASNSSHTLTAVARDAAGNQTTSSPVTIAVANNGSPVTVTLTPVADAYVRSDNLNKNFGTNSELRLRLGNASNPITMRSYLKFTLSGLSGTVTAAKLRLWVTDGSTNRGSTYSTSNAWTETGITWNNAPPAGTLYASGGSAPLRTWVEIVLPAGIFAAGNGDYSFVIAGGNTDRVVYNSRQGGSPPQLVLTIVP